MISNNYKPQQWNRWSGQGEVPLHPNTKVMVRTDMTTSLVPAPVSSVDWESVHSFWVIKPYVEAPKELWVNIYKNETSYHESESRARKVATCHTGGEFLQTVKYVRE